MSRAFRYDILIAGIGMGGPQNTTVGTVRLLRCARITFSLSVHSDFVRSLSRRFVALDDMYFTCDEDRRVYRRIADRVLEEAGRAPGVAIVDDGHPLLYDDVAHDIVRRGRRGGLNVVVLPAISALGALMVQCDVEFDVGGVQIVEATSIVADNTRLNPAFETLVLQLGWFGTSLIARVEGHRRERFEPLQRHLLRFYPPTHRVRIVRASQLPEERPTIIGTRLGRLSSCYRRIALDATLHIPALDSPSVPNRRFEEGLLDPVRLDRIARLAERPL